MEVAEFQGQQIEPLLPELARLRITIFREFPYLYDGDLDYEMRYLQTLVASPRSTLVLVRDQGAVVGASTALPLADEEEDFRRPFLAAGLDPGHFYYFGESLLLISHRGRGLGHEFFDRREAAARRHGFARTCFCAVVRPQDHPRRPSDYRSLEPFWEGRGYRAEPGLATEYRWQDLDESQESPKPMQFWLRHLDR